MRGMVNTELQKSSATDNVSVKQKTGQTIMTSQTACWILWGIIHKLQEGQQEMDDI